jgi:sigma-B regulation protein RsbU (phosphoserine phosphatase)
MTSLYSHIESRYNRMPDSRLRIGYSMIALIALIAIIANVVTLFRYNIKNSDDCLWEFKPRNGDSVLVVGTVAEGGRAEQAGIKEGDRVLAINGGAVNDDMKRAQELLNNSPTEVDIPYVVERDGAVLTLSIKLVKQMQFVNFVMPAFTFLWLLIGAMVAFAQPRGNVQRRFFFTSALAVFAFGNAGFLQGMHLALPWVIIISFAWAILIPMFYVSWVIFCTTFPVDQKVGTTRLRTWLVYIPVIVTALIGLIQSYFIIFQPKTFVTTPTPVQWVISAINPLWFCIGVYFLFRGYRRLPPTVERRPTRIILVGTVLAGLALVYVNWLQLSASGLAFLFYPQYLLPILLLLALPVSFGYAIFNYQVMDFRSVVRTTLVYVATMALIAGGYLAVAYAIGQALGALIGEQMQTTVEVFSFVLILMLFEPVKRQLQTAIENRFFPQRRDYSRDMADYSMAIAETVGTRAVAELTAVTLKQSLKLQGVCVLIENEVAGDLELVARVCDFEPMAVDDTAVNRLRFLLRQSHNLIALETLDEPLLAELQQRFSYAVGLYAQGRVIGAALLTRPHDGESLSGSQTPFITGVVAQGAAALEVARLYEEELARQRYREELAMARRIQESLLPAEMPSFPGISISALSHPAQAVGGDYYDMIRLDDDRLLVVVADVSGKGLPASLYMAEMHGMMRIASAVYSTPKEILTILNQHLVEVMNRGSFITSTMLLFDTARRTVSFARAGHTPIVRRQGSEVDTLVPGGIALGLSGSEKFEKSLQQYTVRYEPGETFILYSDGVSEAMNATREEFGEGRLLDIISAAPSQSADGLLESVFTKVEGFRAGAEQNDDMTIVVVQVEREVMRNPVVPVPVASSRG